MLSPTPRVIAAASVVVSVATGTVTNLITSRWSWTLGAVLVVLIVAGILLAIQATAATPARRSRASIKAKHGARIESSGVTGRNGADVKQTASHEGSIVNSPVDADGSDVRQKAPRKAEIKDSPVDLQ